MGSEEAGLRRATVVVIGVGQAGLSATYHLMRRGFADARTAAPGTRSVIALDAGAGPGGAWVHRWATLTMRTVNRIFDLPDYPQPPIDVDESSRTAVPRYFAGFERAFDLPIERPVRVIGVRRVDDDPDGELEVTTDAGVWRTRYVVNATGTWDHPVLPHYPGQETFLGRQLHTRDYVSNAELAGHRVAIVGGGISALQLLEEISRVAWTAWYTRREPVFIEGRFEPETTGRETIARVVADVEAGRPTGSVVSYTGLGWTPYALAAKARGVLVRRPMFASIEPHGVREADGSFTSVDTILWATGFKPSLAHLDPLRLRNALGGIVMSGTQVVAEPRVQLIGYGPSQSTVGANRAGRDAAAVIARRLRAAEPSTTGRLIG